MTTPLKRVLSAFGLLTALVVLAVVATSSALAYTPGRDAQSTSANRGPVNSGITVGGTTTPGGLIQATALYTFFTPASAPAGTAFFGSAPAGFTNTPQNVSSQFTNIGTMYQQWMQNTSANGVQWFYLYAANANVNSAAPFGSAPAGVQSAGTQNPSFAYYYYTKNRGQRTFASPNQNTGSAAGGGNAGFTQFGQTTTTPGTTFEGVIYNDAAGQSPIMTIIAMGAGAVSPGCAQAQSASCQEFFAAQLRWGLPQDTFKAGPVQILEAVEGSSGLVGDQIPGGSRSGVNFFDPWGNNGGAATVGFSNTAPAQASNGVTNIGSPTAPATRNVGSTYTIGQTITDTNGDLLGGSLVFMYTSGANNGQWFQIGYLNGSDNNNTITTTSGSATYQSAFEPYIASPPNPATGTSSVGGGFVSFSASGSCATPLTGTAGGNQTAGTGCSSETINYTVTFNAQARGTASVFGNAQDHHGGTSGNILTGAVTIS